MVEFAFKVNPGRRKVLIHNVAASIFEAALRASMLNSAMPGVIQPTNDAHVEQHFLYCGKCDIDEYGSVTLSDAIFCVRCKFCWIALNCCTGFESCTFVS